MAIYNKLFKKQTLVEITKVLRVLVKLGFYIALQIAQKANSTSTTGNYCRLFSWLSGMLTEFNGGGLLVLSKLTGLVLISGGGRF